MKIVWYFGYTQMPKTLKGRKAEEKPKVSAGLGVLKTRFSIAIPIPMQQIQFARSHTEF